MGTINYGTSKIVTLGYNVDDEDEIIIQDLYDEAVNIVNKYSFYWFKAEIKSGYYEGFYLDLDKDYYDEDDNNLDNEEINEILDEIKELEKMLMELIDEGCMNVCYPHWCTGWKNYADSKIKVVEAMNKIKEKL